MSLVMRALRTFAFTKEQTDIFASLRPPAKHGTKGTVTTVTAAADTGRSETLKECARLLKTCHGHSGRFGVHYLAFNKETVAEAMRKMPDAIVKTYHSAALSARGSRMRVSCEVIKEPTVLGFVVEHRVVAQIDCFDFSYAGDDLIRLERAKKSLARKLGMNVLKTLTRFLHSAQKVDDGLDPTNAENVPKDVRDWHLGIDGRGAPPGLMDFAQSGWYVRVARDVWLMMTGKWDAAKGPKVEGILLDAVIKDAFLMGLKVHCGATAILVDESQDFTEVMIAWIIKQAEYGVHVIFVGDAAQCIYSFRGAQPGCLYSMSMLQCGLTWNRFTLTTSFRFGFVIASLANLLLMMKARSPQTRVAKNWEPFLLTGGAQEGGIITTESLLDARIWEHGRRLLVIARSNHSRVVEMVKLIVDAEDDDSVPTMTMLGKGENAGRGKMLKIVNQMDMFYSVYVASLRDPPETIVLDTEEFLDMGEISWGILEELVEENFPDVKPIIALINTYGRDTIDIMKRFRKHVLDDRNASADPDISIGTVHQVKGSEAECVQILNDMADLASFSTTKDDEGHLFAEFSLPAIGDDLNILYVSVTRATHILSIPPKVVALVNEMFKLGSAKIEDVNSATRKRPLAHVEGEDGCEADMSGSSQASAVSMASSTSYFTMGSGPNARVFTPDELRALREQLYVPWITEPRAGPHLLNSNSWLNDDHADKF